MLHRFIPINRGEITVSVLASLEVRTAIRRRELAGELSSLDTADILGTLATVTAQILEHPITPQVLSRAARVADLHRLRALDCLQLASALLTKSSLPHGDSLLFVASDERLLNAARLEGLRTSDPTKGFVISNP